MDVENKSEFTVDELTKQTLKCIKLSGIRLWIMIFITIAFIISGIVCAIISASKNIRYTDFLIISGCFFIIFLMLLYYKIGYPRSIKKNYYNTFGEMVKYEFVFHINRFDCELESKEGINKATIKYDDLKKIVEDNGVIRLYIAKRNFLPVKIDKFIPNEFVKIQKAMQNSKTKYIIAKKTTK